MNRNDKLTISYGLLVDTADAIRAKKGTSSAMSPSDFPSAVASIDGSQPLELKMSFKNNTPSIAYGEIVLSAKEAEYSGNYDIMWGDADGVLSDYAKIDTLTLDVANNKTMGSIELMECNAIPEDATRLCAVQNGDIVTSFNIPSDKLWDDEYYGELEHKNVSVGDWHYGYETAASDTQAALEYGVDEEVDAFVGVGDLTANGYTSELDAWLTLRDTYRGNIPFYTCGGNHEAASANAIMTKNPTGLRKYLDTDWTDETENYFLKEIGNDIYIFISVFEGTTHGSGNTMLTSESLDWLEEKLELYRNQRVFLYMHIPPLWSLADMKQNGYHQGFGNGNGAYTLDLWGTSKSDRTRWLNLLDHYKNVIWFSGHSHIKYQYQSVWKHLNVFQYKGGARFVHLSSLVVPRNIIDGSATGLIYAESEGTRVEVYPNHIRLRSMNFITGKFYGACEYIIDTTPVTIPPSSKTLVSISAVKAKASYYTDESASGITDDITITALWSDNTSSVVNNNDVVFDTSNVDLSTAGTYSIGIAYTYGEDTETTSVQVTSSVRPQTKTLASLAVSKVTTAYIVNESLSTLDITGVATYSDNTTANIANGDLTFNTSQVDMTTPGAYPIVVTYIENGVTATATVGITVSSDTGGYTLILDALFDGQISAKSGNIASADVTTFLSGMQVTEANGQAYNEPSSASHDRQLYYRLLEDTGVSESQKIGITVGVGDASNKWQKTSSAYNLTASSWTVLKQTDKTTDLELSSARPLIVANCKASSSSTATFPATVKVRIQIGYPNT